MQEIIFIHGLGQTPSSWDNTLSYLPEQLKAIAIDLSSLCKGSENTYGNLYLQFKDYLRNISKPLNLCGISLGAVLALNYAIEYPQKVASLALIASQYKIPRLLMRFQGLIFNFMPNSTFKDIGFNKKDFSVLTRSMSNLDFSNAIKNISCLPLIVCGKKDKANLKAANELAVKIQSAKLQIIENAGHEVNVDTPEELAGILKCYFQLND